jgi:hypothetical protein
VDLVDRRTFDQVAETESPRMADCAAPRSKAMRFPVISRGRPTSKPPSRGAMKM